MNKTLSSLSFSFAALSLAAQDMPPASTTEQQNSLSPILMYVADKNSADAAAPKVNDMLQQLGEDCIKVDPYDLMLLRTTSCFGSTALQKAMAPLLPELTDDEQAAIQPFLAQLNNLWQAIDDISATLNSISDTNSANQAAEILENFVPYSSLCAEKMCTMASPEQAAARIELHLIYKTGNRIRASRFLQAWAQLVHRAPDYYHSSRLINALVGVRDVFENMGMQIDPDTIPSVMKVAASLRGFMQQWVKEISSVKDRQSADIAANKIQAIRERVAAVAREAGITRSHEEDLFLYTPELELLSHILDRITHYLQDEAQPPFFGSAALRDVLEHED